MGIRGMQIAEHVQQVQATWEHLRQDFGEARGRFDRAGDQLRYAVQNIDSARLTLREIEARLERIGQSAATESG
jgi:DNA anti-recombination protein RmuC